MLTCCSLCTSQLPVPVQKRPPSTSTRSPAACWALAGSWSLRPYWAGPAGSRQSTAKYTLPLPPPHLLPPPQPLHPPCLTHSPSRRQQTLHRRPRATPRISTIACSSPRACPSISAKVSDFQDNFRRSSYSSAESGLQLFIWWISCMFPLTPLHMSWISVNKRTARLVIIFIHNLDSRPSSISVLFDNPPAMFALAGRAAPLPVALYDDL